MKLQLAALLLPAALFVAACDENTPPERDSRTAINNHDGSSSAASGAARQPVDDAVTIPEGAAWTVCCDVLTGPDHVGRAAELKTKLISLTGRKDFYVVHKDDQSSIYFGFYKSIQKEDDPAEYDRSHADLQYVRGLSDSTTGERIFREPILQPIDGPDPDAPGEWNLANAPANMFWSLQIAAYTGGADRKKLAVESVRGFRKDGIPAYYYHGDTVSSVCIGLWPVGAVQNQSDDPRYGGSGHTVDPNQPLMVLGGTSAPPNLSPDMKDATGNKVELEGIKLEILDQSLRDWISRYPHEAVNGMEHYKPLPGGEKFFDQTFLVQVPHGSNSGDQAGAPAQPTPPEQSAPPDSLGPDPTQGTLRSLGDK